ncbi:MAG: gamma-glutamylcyclotransferase [Acidiferrobacterales bacterium]
MGLRKPFIRLTDSARRDSLRAILEAAPHGDMWVFGYGSLMWNSEFSYIERRVGTLVGYQRRLCVLSSRARGTAENPGLGLGLEPGEGECRGIAYRLNPAMLDEDLKALWDREMSTGIYQPHWLPVVTVEGEVTAIAFVVDRNHRQYAGYLSQDEMVALIVSASGHYGPCHEYLANTVRELTALGVSEPGFETLLARVDAEGER